MNREQIIQLFDQQAPNYDKQWKKMSAIYEGLYFLMESLVSELESNAHILCVGAGTGKEVSFLAQRFSGWKFTVLEPSGAMLGLCRESLEKQGFASRCTFHEGYLDSLRVPAKYDAATCFAVSHFMLDPNERTGFFSQIAHRLKTEGLLIGSDLCFDIHAGNYTNMLSLWFKIMSDADISEENIQRMKQAYTNDVAIVPWPKIMAMLDDAGFHGSTPFYQAGLIQAYFSRRT